MDPSDIIVGVDTHKSLHAAVAINGLGAMLGTTTCPTTCRGYEQLESWASSFGLVKAYGIEGTGSYGAGLSRSLMENGNTVIEVNRPNRQLRYQEGKSDPLDAEGAARSVLSGQANAEPKTGLGVVEMIRHFKIARDTAVKSRTQAMVTLKTIIINAPTHLREELDCLSGKMTLVRKLAALRPGEINTTTASAKAALRALAQRWLILNSEIKEHDQQLKTLTQAAAPSLGESHGISTLTIAEMLVLLGDNPERIHSEAAFAKICGVCPIPASSGKTNRHRLNRGGNRKANAALYRVAIVRMRAHPPTLKYVQKRTADGKSKSEIIRCLKRFIAREIYRHLCVRKINQKVH